MPPDETTPARRERSARYPGVPIAEAFELIRFIDDRGLDSLSAAEIARAAGYKNVKTNTFSARLSAARQFGLLAIRDEQYSLTPLARSILHPTDPAEVAALKREAFLASTLYVELAERLAGKKVPDAAILGNVLYHHYNIIGSAKESAADAFLESARSLGILGEDGIFLLSDRSIPTPAPAPAASRPTKPPSSAVRIDLRLWDADDGKSIRVRCPESITAASFERLLQSLRLHVRIEDPANEV